MDLLPKSHQEFSQKEYWDTFFKKRGNKAFEWYGEYPELSEHLHKYMKTQDNILIVGCGNSTLGPDLYDLGYSNITNIDISPVVIKQMLTKNEKARPNLKYIQMDALNMNFENEIFTAVLDKGTLDALMPNDSAETLADIKKYLNEISRALRNGGRYICISLLQEHILKTVLEYFPNNNWMLRIVRCFEAENKALNAGESSMPVFMVICTKFKALPSLVLEVNLANGGKMQRLQSTAEVKQHITNTQQAAFVCSGLKRSSLANTGEVSFELFEPSSKSPRFTVYVVDVPKDPRHKDYAAFVVPHGRETEWLFSTDTGRKNLVKMCGHNRLAIVTMHTGQVYGDLAGIQGELTDVVVNLAPSNFKSKILFLSLGSDVGKRTVRYRGHSEISGDYVVEDIENEKGEKFRRLYYLRTQSVIQSEAKLRTITTKKSGTKEIIDATHLTCNHHVYMSIATCMVCKNKQKPSIAIIGLGGGGLCTFLSKFLPKTHITGIDIDEHMLKVATEWFGLNLSDKLSVKIVDGIEFLGNTQAEPFDAILFDVDSKDSSTGMSCPPKQFLTKKVLQNVKNALKKDGLFVLNMVLRDESLRPKIVSDLKGVFDITVGYKLEEDLNEVVACCVDKIGEEEFCKKYQDACDDINKFFVKNKLEKIESCLSKLKINK